MLGSDDVSSRPKSRRNIKTVSSANFKPLSVVVWGCASVHAMDNTYVKVTLMLEGIKAAYAAFKPHSAWITTACKTVCVQDRLS